MNIFFNSYFYRMYEFYTTWSLFLHLLHMMGVISSTWMIALFVMIVGTIIFVVNHARYSYTIAHTFSVTLIHAFPLLLLKPQYRYYELFITLIMYLILYGPEQIFRIYDNPIDRIRCHLKTLVCPLLCPHRRSQVEPGTDAPCTLPLRS